MDSLSRHPIFAGGKISVHERSRERGQPESDARPGLAGVPAYAHSRARRQRRNSESEMCHSGDVKSSPDGIRITLRTRRVVVRHQERASMVIWISAAYEQEDDSTNKMFVCGVVSWTWSRPGERVDRERMSSGDQGGSAWVGDVARKGTAQQL